MDNPLKKETINGLMASIKSKVPIRNEEIIDLDALVKFLARNRTFLKSGFLCVDFFVYI